MTICASTNVTKCAWSAECFISCVVLFQDTVMRATAFNRDAGRRAAASAALGLPLHGNAEDAGIAASAVLQAGIGILVFAPKAAAALLLSSVENSYSLPACRQQHIGQSLAAVQACCATVIL